MEGRGLDQSGQTGADCVSCGPELEVGLEELLAQKSMHTHTLTQWQPKPDPGRISLFRAEFLNLGTIDILGQIILCWQRMSSVLRIFI